MRYTAEITRFVPFEWAPCPIAETRRLFEWGKTPFVPQTVTELSPILKKLLLESNAEVFYIYIYIYMVGLNHQQCKTIFTERFRLSPSSEFTGTRKKSKFQHFYR